MTDENKNKTPEAGKELATGTAVAERPKDEKELNAALGETMETSDSREDHEDIEANKSFAQTTFDMILEGALPYQYNFDKNILDKNINDLRQIILKAQKEGLDLNLERPLTKKINYSLDHARPKDVRALLTLATEFGLKEPLSKTSVENCFRSCVGISNLHPIEDLHIVLSEFKLNDYFDTKALVSIVEDDTIEDFETFSYFDVEDAQRFLQKFDSEPDVEKIYSKGMKLALEKRIISFRDAYEYAKEHDIKMPEFTEQDFKKSMENMRASSISPNKKTQIEKMFSDLIKKEFGYDIK